MKKLMFRIAIVLGLLVVITIGFYYHKVHRIHNIFDEIYYEESDYRSYEQLFRKRAFSKIKDINSMIIIQKIFINIEWSIKKINYQAISLSCPIISIF